MDLFNAKYKINEKVKYFDLIGVVIDAKLIIKAKDKGKEC